VEIDEVPKKEEGETDGETTKITFRVFDGAINAIQRAKRETGGGGEG